MGHILSVIFFEASNETNSLVFETLDMKVKHTCNGVWIVGGRVASLKFKYTF